MRPPRGPSIATPMARNAATVASASAPSRKPVAADSPSASEPSITKRCETDLSPGTRTRPVSAPPGSTR